MQKRIFIFLFFVFTFLSYSTFAEAALQFLPRYQGGYGVRSQEGGKDKVTVTCASRGGVEKGANQTCTGVFTAGGKTCYKSCTCPSSFQYTTASHQGTGKLCASLSNACTVNNVTKYSVCNLNTCNARNSSWIGENSKASYTSNNYSCTSQNTSGSDGTCYVCACPASWASGSCPANAASCSTCKAVSPYTTNKFNLVSCKAGYYKNGNSCTQCPAGYKCDGINKTQCPGGSYAAAGASTCSQCLAGQYSSAGASSCLLCAMGTYAAAGSTSCSECRAGTYSAIGSSSCTSCSAGKYSAAGASYCNICAAGTYSNAGASSCSTCNAGSYSSAGASSCSNCPSGTVANSSHTGCLNDTCASGYQSAACSANQIQTASAKVDSGRTCYACRAKTCADGGFAASCPSGQTGTSVSYAGLSCVKDCKNACGSLYQYTCVGVGYASGYGTPCDGKYTRCNCASGYKWSNGSCVAKTCDDGYYSSKSVCTNTGYYCESLSIKTGDKYSTCYAPISRCEQDSVAGIYGGTDCKSVINYSKGVNGYSQDFCYEAQNYFILSGQGGNWQNVTWPFVGGHKPVNSGEYNSWVSSFYDCCKYCTK